MDYLGATHPDYDALLKKMNIAKKRFSNESKLFEIKRMEKQIERGGSDEKQAAIHEALK